MADDRSTGTALAAPTWRRRLLDGLLLAALALMTLVLPVLVIQTQSYKRAGWASLMLIVYAVTAASLFARRAPYTVRALGLLIGLAAVSWLGYLLLRRSRFARSTHPPRCWWRRTSSRCGA